MNKIKAIDDRPNNYCLLCCKEFREISFVYVWINVSISYRILIISSHNFNLIALPCRIADAMKTITTTSGEPILNKGWSKFNEGYETMKIEEEQEEYGEEHIR